MAARWIALAAIAGAAGLSAAPAPAAARAAAAKDWTRTVALTPAGGFRMGNPAAKVKLVEYGSLTCPHCAHFAADGTAAVRGMVKSGKLSFEFRNFVLNGPDIAATLLARCGGAKSFFPIVDTMYATQRQWVGAIEALPDEQKSAIDALPLKQRIVRVAEAGRLADVASKSGVPAARATQCLTDDAALAMLQKLNSDGVKLGVTGTPTFFINGQKATAFTWAELEPDLKAALGTSG
jgi:protein-disulfide isomerase